MHIDNQYPDQIRLYPGRDQDLFFDSAIYLVDGQITFDVQVNKSAPVQHKDESKKS